MHKKVVLISLASLVLLLVIAAPFIGDVNRDGSVNVLDVIFVGGAPFASQEGDPNYREASDLDLDGDVDLFDLLIVTNNFNEQNECTDDDADNSYVELGCQLGPVDCNDANANIFPGATEICDGVDNSCDTFVDTDSEGTPLTETCYTGPQGTAGVGVCQGGSATCSDGSLGACIGEVLPSAELCDGFDNDCDALTDEDPAGGALTESCYTGPPQTENVGECSAGIRTCSAGSFGACTQQVLPVLEICSDGLDNDCDGLTDGDDLSCSDINDLVRSVADGSITFDLQGNVYTVTVQSIVGTADNAQAVFVVNGETTSALGRQDFVFLNDGSFLQVNDFIPLDDPESSNPSHVHFTIMIPFCPDQDGDGYGEFVSSVCPQQGLDCNDQNSNIFPGATEICDGFDNDCDDFIDENEQNTALTRTCYTGPQGTQGVGQCTAGTQTCTNSVYGVCVGEVLPDSRETCNDGIDNDCDAFTDASDTECSVCTDNDLDGYGVFGSSACPNTGFDFDDTNFFLNPGAREICNDGIDNNGDTIIDFADASCSALTGLYCFDALNSAIVGVPGAITRVPDNDGDLTYNWAGGIPGRSTIVFPLALGVTTTSTLEIWILSIGGIPITQIGATVDVITPAGISPTVPLVTLNGGPILSGTGKYQSTIISTPFTVFPPVGGIPNTITGVGFTSPVTLMPPSLIYAACVTL